VIIVVQVAGVSFQYLVEWSGLATNNGNQNKQKNNLKNLHTKRSRKTWKNNTKSKKPQE